MCQWSGDLLHLKGKWTALQSSNSVLLAAGGITLAKCAFTPGDSREWHCCSPGRKQDTVHCTDATETAIFHLSFFQKNQQFLHWYCVHNVSREQGSGKRYFVYRDVNMSPFTGRVTTITFRIDPGATYVIPKQYLQQLNHSPLQQSTYIISLYRVFPAMWPYPCQPVLAATLENKQIQNGCCGIYCMCYKADAIKLCFFTRWSISAEVHL